MIRKSSALLVSLVLVAFGLRVHHLGSPPLLWDEGWSIGLSRLPVTEILRITALDVHPPFYYVLLKAWLALGPHEFLTRFLSVIAGVLTVPLGYHAGRLWRDRTVGLLTALYITIEPALVYYSQIARMFAWCVAFLVLGLCGLLRITQVAEVRRTPRTRKSIWIAFCAWVIGATGAVYSFYYAGFALAALFAYALLIAPRRWRLTLPAFGGVAVLYLPWVLYAAPAMLNRVSERTGLNFAIGRATSLASDAFYGLVFPYGVGWPAVYALVLVVVAGAAVGVRRLGRWALLPVLVVGATLFGAALGAQAHMLAARYTIVASPFLALAVASALALLRGEGGKVRKRTGAEGASSPLSCSLKSAHRQWVFVLGVILILLTTVPTITSYVYAKSYEIFEPFDPSANWQVLHEPADAGDVVFFNVLSLAGTYERYRTRDDPPWSYALRWDPVIEPLAAAQARIEAAAASHERLWFVLYKGTVAANADLVAWLDRRFYPTEAPGWRGDTLYLAYVDPRGPWREVNIGARFGNIVLNAARYTSVTSPPSCPMCDAIGVELNWHAGGPIERDAKVFVHLYDATGRLIAQHDSIPVNGSRPVATWEAGEALVDRHGLALPDEPLSGPLRIAAGLYDPATGARYRASDGREVITVGTVTGTVVPGERGAE